MSMPGLVSHPSVPAKWLAPQHPANVYVLTVEPMYHQFQFLALNCDFINAHVVGRLHICQCLRVCATMEGGAQDAGDIEGKQASYTGNAGTVLTVCCLFPV